MCIRVKKYKAKEGFCMKDKIFNILDNVATAIVCIIFLLLVFSIMVGFIISAWKTSVFIGLLAILIIASILWLIARDKFL